MNWLVEDGKFILPSGTGVSARCHHRKNGSGACGGCYARLATLLDDIYSAEDPKALIAEVHAAMIAEGNRRNEQ